MTRSERWPCAECGGTARGVRNLGSRGYCAAHLSELYSRFDPVVFGLSGVMVQAGRMRPDWGPAFCDVQCIACGATEVGIVGEACWWCQRSHDIVCAWQAEIVVRVPDVDPDDARYEPAMKAWAQRMATAVKAGVVTRDQANAVWRRAVARAA